MQTPGPSVNRSSAIGYALLSLDMSNLWVELIMISSENGETIEDAITSIFISFIGHCEVLGAQYSDSG